jgi:hypothetical protein
MSSFRDCHCIHFRRPDDAGPDGVLYRGALVYFDCGRAYLQYGRYVSVTKGSSVSDGGCEYTRLEPGALHLPEHGSLWSRLGFRFLYRQFNKGLGYNGAGYNVGLEFPLWLPTLIAAAIPLGRFCRRLRRRHTTPGGFHLRSPQ